MKGRANTKESQTTEFKLSWWEEYLKVICAFLNSKMDIIGTFLTFNRRWTQRAQ